VFAKNTTEALNRLARSMRMPEGSVVLTTMPEHQSNDLPWRARTRAVRVPALPDGTLDEDALDGLLAEHAGRVALLAVAGMVRISLGAYNDMADIDRAVRALEWLVAGEVQGRYRAGSDGTFVPDGYTEPLLFDLGGPGLSD
jgi:selenocysteine lyase/cysteine desulfurase